MKRSKVFRRLGLAVLGCALMLGAATPASLAGNRCKDRCNDFYNRRKQECKGMRKWERKRCEDRAKHEREECKHRCR
jgi:hypothetical protein